MDAQVEYVRAVELARRWPIFSTSRWRVFIARGVLPSHRVGGTRLVRVCDVHAFLAGAP